jgi:hypothetical protein
MVKSLLKSQASLTHEFSGSEKLRSSASPAALTADSGFIQSAAPSPHNQITPNVPKNSMGKFTGEKDEVNFVGSEHWEAILENIAELKIDLETPNTNEMLDFKPQLLFGMNQASRSEIMSSIPSKLICDMLIARWFKKMDMAPRKLTIHHAGIWEY